MPTSAEQPPKGSNAAFLQHESSLGCYMSFFCDRENASDKCFADYSILRTRKHPQL